MEASAYIKNINSSPKKLRLLIHSVKNLLPVEAIEVLRYTPKKSAKNLSKAIASALSNARQTLKVPDYMVQFKTLLVEEGIKLKRYNPGSRGTAKPYIKRYSHLKIVLKAKELPQEVKSVVNETKTKSVKQVEKEVKTTENKEVKKQEKKQVKRAAKTAKK